MVCLICIFYIKYHTNNDRGRVFNSHKVLYRKQNVFKIMLRLFKCSMKTSLTCNHTWMISITYLILNLPESIMSSRSVQIVYCQDDHGKVESNQNYKKCNTYSGAKSKLRIRKTFRHLKQLEKPKVRVENRVTLSKFCCFVVREDQDYWIY